MQNRRPLSLKVAPELPLLSLHPCGTLSWASLRAGSAGKGHRQHQWFCLPAPELLPGLPRASPERQRVWKGSAHTCTPVQAPDGPSEVLAISPHLRHPQPSCLPTQPIFLLSIFWSSVGDGQTHGCLSICGRPRIHPHECEVLASAEQRTEHLFEMCPIPQGHAHCSLSPSPRLRCHDVTSAWERGGEGPGCTAPALPRDGELLAVATWDSRCCPWEDKVTQLPAFFSPMLTGHLFCAERSEDSREPSQS